MSEVRIERSSARTVRIAAREFVYFGGCDYLGLAHHPAVREALIEASARFGISSGASRATSGTTCEHEALEEELAAFLGAPAVLITSDGWTADLAATETSALSRRRARIDARGHASLFDSARAASLEIERYESCDVEAALRGAASDTLVMTDGAFPSSGRLAPIGELAARSREAGAALLCDDAHGLGVLGPNGRGTAAEFGVLPDEDRVLTGTLSKALGVAGGFVAASREFVLRTRQARAYVGTTPISPALAAAARTALGLVAGGEHKAALAERVGRFRAGVASTAIADEVDERLPVFAVELESPERTRELYRELLARGLFVPFIRYLADRPNEYLRLVIRAVHDAEDIERLCAVLNESRFANVRAR